MTKENESAPGLIQALTSVWHGLIEALQDRCELFGIELREERNSAAVLLGLVLAIGFTAFMAFLLLNLAVVVIFWDHRIALCLGLCAIYTVAALVLLVRLRQRLRDEPEPFHETIEELKRDQAGLSKR